MLATLTITLQKPENQYLNQNITSLLQGVLMDNISYEYGEILHLSQLKPYSQYISFNGDNITWKISSCNQEFKENVLDYWISTNLNNIYLKHKDLHLQIINKNIEISSYNELIENTFFGNSNNQFIIEFISPTSFKSNNKYIIYPSLQHIFQSLMNKFDTYSDSNSIISEELLNDIVKHTEIISYNLKSVKFHLEGISIPSFKGNITINIRGNNQLANVVHMLLKYGEYSGVGVKCAIGMGGIKITERNRKI